MKKHVFLSIVMFSFYTLPGQIHEKNFITEISETTLSTSQKEKVNKYRLNSLYLNVSVVKIESLKTFEKDGRFELNIPGRAQKSVVERSNLEVLSEAKYTYRGTFDAGNAQILLNSNEFGLFGRIITDHDIIMIEDIGKGMSVLLWINKEKLTSAECGTVSAESPKQKPKSELTTRNICGKPVSVGVMFTENAENTGLNMLNIAQNGISDLNTIMWNSDVGGGILFTLTGIGFLDNFNENTNNPLGDAQSLLTNTEVQNFKNDQLADIIILLTDGNYLNNQIFGAASAIGPDEDIAYAVVEADNANGVFTFSHELMHLIGARHQQCDVFNGGGGCSTGGGYEYGWNYLDGIWPFQNEETTLMHQQRPGWDRQLLLSNPDIEGRVDLNDNARWVFENFCTVSEYVAEPMSTIISGPSQLEAYQNGTWCVSVSNCSNVSSISWEVSYDGWNYFPFSQSSCLTYTIFNNPIMYLRNTVTCSDGQSVMKIYYVSLAPTYAIGKDLNSKFKKEIVSARDLEVYPNPATSQVDIVIEANQGEIWKVNLTDLLGKMYTLDEVVAQETGKNVFNLNIPNSVGSGVYLISMSCESRQLGKKLLIVKE